MKEWIGNQILEFLKGQKTAIDCAIHDVNELSEPFSHITLSTDIAHHNISVARELDMKITLEQHTKLIKEQTELTNKLIDRIINLEILLSEGEKKCLSGLIQK